MPKQYLITAAIEMPDGLGPRSALIAKMQPAIEAFRAALEKQGFAAVVTETLREPRGPKAPKAVEEPPASPALVRDAAE
jgi:hypothetical protein